MTSGGKYIYCFIRSDRPREVSCQGIGGHKVFTVHFRDLAAVVSDFPGVSQDNRVQDLSRQQIMAHQRVIEEVMKEFTVLPLRFGTIASSVEDIQEKLLRRKFEELSALLSELESKVELGVKAFWRGDIVQEIATEDPKIRRLRGSLKGLPFSQFRVGQARISEMVATAVESKRKKAAEKILTTLRPLAERVQENRIIMPDKMILNATFLVDKDREGEFDEAVEKLDREMGERALFKYLGPTPPYNFVNLVIIWNQ